MIKGANELIDIPVSFIHDRFQIPMAKDGEEVLPRATVREPTTNLENSEFSSCPHCGGSHDFSEQEDEIDRLTEKTSAEADAAISDFALPIQELLDRVKTPLEFQQGLAKMYPAMDITRLGELTEQAMLLSYLQGMDGD